MTSLPENIFNTSKTDYGNSNILLGPQSVGLFDTVNKQHHDIWKLYKSMKSLDWDENEFDYSSCINDFKTCSESEYSAVIKNLAYQWEADSVASRVAPIASNFLTNSEAWAAEQRISDNENVHAATYSEIVRCSFENPKEVLGSVLANIEAFERLSCVADVFEEARKASFSYALGLVKNDQETYNKAFMFYVALFALERIQFPSSFGVTFSVADSGKFQPIGKAVQKIAQDEMEVHVEYRKALLSYELTTVRGQIALKQLKPKIQELFDQVLDGEKKFNAFIFSDGEELENLNQKRLDKVSEFYARECYEFFGLDGFDLLPSDHPLPLMNRWTNISKNQGSPQEEKLGQYRVNIVRRDDAGKTFDFDYPFV